MSLDKNDANLLFESIVPPTVSNDEKVYVEYPYNQKFSESLNYSKQLKLQSLDFHQT